MKTVVLALITTFGTAVGASAQVPPPDPAGMPERPTVGTHAGTIAAGWVEVEVGIEITGPQPRAIYAGFTYSLGSLGR